MPTNESRITTNDPRPTPRPGGEDEINLLDYFRVIVKFRWMILGLTGLAMVATGVISLLQPRVYQASTSIVPPIDMLQKEGGLSSKLGGQAKSLLGGLGGVADIADMYTGILKSRVVADAMVDRFDLLKVYKKVRTRTDARTKLSQNTAIKVSDDGIVAVTVKDADPNRAAAIANAYAEGLDRQNKRLSGGQATSKRLFLETRLQEIKAELTKIETLPTKEAQIKEMIFEMLAREFELAKMEEAKSMPTIQVLDTALAPERPVGRGTVKKGIMAGIAALMLGIFLAFAREYVANSQSR